LQARDDKRAGKLRCPACQQVFTISDQSAPPDHRLTNCPDCNERISRKARSCPHCGAPLVATTIEQTGKTWKVVQLVGFLSAAVGFGVLVSGQSQLPRGVLVVSFLAGFFGLIAFLVGRIGAWWYHG
jgi:predicted Zn finger-like uncharacterized protein